MMGRTDQSRSSKLFYILDLEKEMPADRILRKSCRSSMAWPS